MREIQYRLLSIVPNSDLVRCDELQLSLAIKWKTTLIQHDFSEGLLVFDKLLIERAHFIKTGLHRNCANDLVRVALWKLLEVGNNWQLRAAHKNLNKLNISILTSEK